MLLPTVFSSGMDWQFSFINANETGLVINCSNTPTGNIQMIACHMTDFKFLDTNIEHHFVKKNFMDLQPMHIHVYMWRKI